MFYVPSSVIDCVVDIWNTHFCFVPIFLTKGFDCLLKIIFENKDPRLGVLLENCLCFGRFQPVAAYKCVDYKKKRVIN